jgi:hypothetical protein
MEDNQIPPKNEWPNLSVSQLHDVKNALLNKYWAMRGINASFANSYLGFVNHVDAIIAYKENEAQTAEHD